MHSEIHEYNDKPRKLYTEIYPVDLDTGRVILGYKRRGFGVGKYIGFGGKVEPGETISEGAARELEEESTLRIRPDSLLPIGILFLESLSPLTAPPTNSTMTSHDLMPNNTLPILEIHTFLAPLHCCTGTAQRTEEMDPHTFSYIPGVSQIPYDQMWTEAASWLPQMLANLPPNTDKLINNFIVHHAVFTGCVSPNTGLWDPWENMHESGLETCEDSGVNALARWGEKERGEWIEKKRRQGWWLKR